MKSYPTGSPIGLNRSIGLGARSTVPTLNLSSYGTFTRSSVATYLTSNPTDGTVGFITQAAVNQRRLEFGAMLFEGSRTNQCLWNRDLANVQWSGGTYTSNYANGVDGTLVADRVQTAALASSRYQNIPSGAILATRSAWMRTTSGTGTLRISSVGPGLVPTSNEVAEIAGTTTYARAAFTSTVNGVFDMYLDGRDYSLLGGTGAVAQDGIVDGFQLEAGNFASSVIFTSGSTTRAADILTAPYANCPTWIRDARHSVTITPICSSTQSAGGAAADQTLFSYNTGLTDRTFLFHSAGTVKVRVVSGGVTKVDSNAITYNAYQPITILLDPVAGSVNITGATTGNGTVVGTSWTRPGGSTTFYIGNDSTAATPLFARMSNPYAA